MASSKSEGRVLLPPHVEPLAYDIDITPDLEVRGCCFFALRPRPCLSDRP